MVPMHHILIIEDDRDLASNLMDFLEVHGYSLDYASDGQSALALLEENHYDLILLDNGLPGMSGLALCKQLREVHKNPVQIIFLTARDDVDTKITAFDLGADDYVVKPASLKEIEARIRARLRRASPSIQHEVLRVGDLCFDTGSMRVERAGQLLTIAPVPARILMLLMRQSPNVVSYEDMSREIWGGNIQADSHALAVHMHSLRTAIDKPFDNEMIHTVRGFGYRLAQDESGV